MAEQKNMKQLFENIPMVVARTDAFEKKLKVGTKKIMRTMYICKRQQQLIVHVVQIRFKTDAYKISGGFTIHVGYVAQCIRQLQPQIILFKQQEFDTRFIVKQFVVEALADVIVIILRS